MTDPNNNYSHTAMLIRKPVEEVFNAFIDPKITTKFWFTKSSGKLVEGAKIQWTWEMFNHTVSILVRSIIPNEKIIIQWEDDVDAQVEWTFEKYADGQTFVNITNHGIKGTPDEIVAAVRDSTGGFTWVLAGLKALLEHDLKLNFIADRYPVKK